MTQHLDPRDATRRERIQQIAADLIRCKPVADGRHIWLRADCYAEFDAAGELDRILSSYDELELLDAVAAARGRRDRAAQSIAERIVDDVIALERKEEEARHVQP